MATTKVLLVEDEWLIRMVVAEYLQDEGFEVTEAGDGDEAIRLPDNPGRFDVVFTDVQMPGTFDGIDVALHARGHHPNIPLVIVSGYAPEITSRLAVFQPSATFFANLIHFGEVRAALLRP